MGRILTPPMPPSLLYFSISHSAAFLDGTPNTAAAPERKDTTPIFSSAGLDCPAARSAGTVTAARTTAAARLTTVVDMFFGRFIDHLLPSWVEIPLAPPAPGHEAGTSLAPRPD